MKKNKHTPVIKKVRSLMNTDIYYTMSDWDTKDIDGVPFIPVVRKQPEYNLKQPVFYMRKDNLEVVK